MNRILLALSVTAGLGMVSAHACEFSDQIGTDSCPFTVAFAKHDTNNDKVVTSTELVAAAKDESLAGTAAATGMTGKIADIIVRMVDSNKDKQVSLGDGA